MCIICYKPAGAALPSRETLRNCFVNNPDGAGVMIKRGGVIKIKKGFFNFNELFETLTAEDLTAFDVGIHCRITTHGATCAENCHPFIVSRKLRRLRQTDATSDAALMHNGVIHAVNVPLTSKLSDTAIFTRDIVARLKAMEDDELTQSHHARKIIDSLRGSSRLLLFDVSGVKMFGNFTEFNGCYYSNDSYSNYPRVWNIQTFNTFNKLDDEEGASDWLEDYTPAGATLEFNACEYCWNRSECLQLGEYCLSETEAELQAYGDYIDDKKEVLVYD